MEYEYNATTRSYWLHGGPQQGSFGLYPLPQQGLELCFLYGQNGWSGYIRYVFREGALDKGKHERWRIAGRGMKFEELKPHLKPFHSHASLLREAQGLPSQVKAQLQQALEQIVDTAAPPNSAREQ